MAGSRPKKGKRFGFDGLNYIRLRYRCLGYLATGRFCV